MAPLFWPLLLQTLTASGVAVLPLVLTAIFRDMLSPRWQYAVWSVLALRLLVPAGFGGWYVLFPWPLFAETPRVLSDTGAPWARALPDLLGWQVDVYEDQRHVETLFLLPGEVGA